MSIKIVKGSYSSVVDSASLSGNQTLTLPNASGTVALTNQFAKVATTGSYNDLSNKPSIPESQQGYITQTWRSGNNWYRVYSDGWIEQGGYYTNSSNTTRTLTLNKSFTTTTYSITKNNHSAVNYNMQFRWCNFYSLKTNQAVTVESTADFTIVSWYACGY